MIVVYVDDIMLSGSDEEYVSTIIEQLKERFDPVDLGDAKFLLVLRIQRNDDAGTILPTQEAYAKAVLDNFGMADAHPAKTPAEAGPICTGEEEILSPEDIKRFRSVTGSLLYLSKCARPNITQSVMGLTRSMSHPGLRAIIELKRVLRYLKGTVSIRITNREDAEDGDKLTAYVDLNHADDQDKGYSTTGVFFNLEGRPVDWKSTKQTVVAIPTVKAEYVAMSKACVTILHFRTLLESINEKQKQATVEFEDNSSAVSLGRRPEITPRNKHIDLRFHHVRSLTAEGVVDVTYIKTELQRTDIITKRLGAANFPKNRLVPLAV